MKITSVALPPPPREVTMTFSRGEGWAVVAALRDYAERHPEAYHASVWCEWAKTLDKELRRDV